MQRTTKEFPKGKVTIETEDGGIISYPLDAISSMYTGKLNERGQLGSISLEAGKIGILIVLNEQRTKKQENGE